MEKHEKQRIAQSLAIFCQRAGGVAKAAALMRGVSAAIIAQAMEGNLEQITDAMWRRIADRTGLAPAGWNMAPTTTYRVLNGLLADAQRLNCVHAVVGSAGCGKTCTAANYAARNPNTFRVVCAEHWNKKVFLARLLEALGAEADERSVDEMVEQVVERVRSLDNPLIIWDEADKLNDAVLYFFITLYNRLEDRCAMVLLATDFLEKRIRRGVALQKKGYNEIYSRIGRRFVRLPDNTYEDQAAVCTSNGVSDPREVERIIDSSESDLRRVRKLARARAAGKNGKNEKQSGDGGQE